MSKTIQIRDVDEATYQSLRRHAADANVSVPELLRREAVRVASKPTMREWLERAAASTSQVHSDDVMDALDEIRGARPDAGR